MATLILEELNLVTLNELLQRLPDSTMVGDLTRVINERELFRPEEASAIVAHFSIAPSKNPAEDGDYESTPEVVRDTLRSLVSSNCGKWTGSHCIPLFKYLPMHVNRTHQLKFSQYPDDSTTLEVYNPTIGQAFWPTVCEVLAMVIEAGNDKVADLMQAVIEASEKLGEYPHETHCP